MKKIPVIIDTDPGIDDSLALLLAFKSKKLDIKLITTVAGNVNVDVNTENALFLVNKYGYEIPVVRGSEKPLVRTSIAADDVHGASGLGNFEKDPTENAPDGTIAEDAIAAMLKSSPEPMTVIALGPLTNIAKLIMKHPDALIKIKRLFLMVGSFVGKGNIVKYAEFNAFADGEALDIVLKSNVDIVLSPIELGHQTAISKDIFSSEKITSERDMMITEMVEGGVDSVVKGNFSLHDLNTILALTKPCLYRFRKCDATLTLAKDKYAQMKINFTRKGKYTAQIIKNPKRVKKYFLKKIYED